METPASQSGLAMIATVWQSLCIQLTPANHLIAIPEMLFDSFSRNDMQYLVDAYGVTVHQQGMFARDGAVDGAFGRVFLGPLNHFRSQTLIHLHDQIPILVPTIPVKSMSISKSPRAGTSLKDKIPRPPNAFIVYRKAHHAKIVAQNPGIKNNRISVIIGDMWNRESVAVRAGYGAEADRLKQEHHRQHPTYKYKPRKSSERKRRVSSKKTPTASFQAASRYPSMSQDTETTDDALTKNTTENEDIESLTVTFPLADDSPSSIIKLHAEAINAADSIAAAPVAGIAIPAVAQVSNFQPTDSYVTAQAIDQIAFNHPDLVIRNVGDDIYDAFLKDLAEGYNDAVQEDYDFLQGSDGENWAFFSSEE